MDEALNEWEIDSMAGTHGWDDETTRSVHDASDVARDKGLSFDLMDPSDQVGDFPNYVYFKDQGGKVWEAAYNEDLDEYELFPTTDT